MNDSKLMPSVDDGPTILETIKGRPGDGLQFEPYLLVLLAHGQSKHYRLSQQHNIFGRAGDDVDIVVDDSKVSRKHGVFIVYPDEIVLQDYQSTNGCYVDGVRIERQAIGVTSRIQVGNTLMKLEYKSASEVESERALYRAANTDELTNILNRRAFMARAQEEISFSNRNHGNLAILMCDVDFFKKINDKFGHPAGDQVLRDLAKILRMEMRKEDMVARYGGEEFIILVRNTETSSVLKWAERVRSRVEKFSFTFQDKSIPATLSIGVHCNNEKIIALDEFIQKADNALYQAKHKGRNRVELAD